MVESGGERRSKQPKDASLLLFFQVKLGDMSLTPLNLIESTQEHTLSPAYSELSTCALSTFGFHTKLTG